MIRAGRFFALVLLPAGIFLALGGAELVRSGGSPYYLAAGAIALICAGLAWRRSAVATPLFSGLVLATFAWALSESGLDRWALAARVMAPAALGLWLLVPSRVKEPMWVRCSRLGPLAALTFVVAVLVSPERVAPPQEFPKEAMPDPFVSGVDWRFYGGDAGGSRYSALDQINPANVSELQVVWTHELPVPVDGRFSNMEVTPLKVGDSLYVCSNANVVEALDPVTGNVRWQFDPEIEATNLPASRTCRGVAYFKDGQATGHCAERILAAAVDAGLWALDAGDGRPCADFGQNGRADLSLGMGPIGDGYFYTSSAPVVIRGKVVLGGWVTDNQKLDSPPGVLRAYDVRTGAFAWAFDIGRPDQHGEPPEGETYTLGTPNAWAPMSVDEELGLLYVPTGNASPDAYGGQRSPEADRYASSLVALDGESGEVRWSFQTVHHDLWDYDVPSQPSLVDLQTESGLVQAVLQATKAGRVFLLDRRTGTALSRVIETLVPQSTVPGERSSPTQPIPVDMPQFDGPRLTEAMMWGVTPLDQLLCRIRFRKADYQGPYTPPGIGRETINWPGFMGSMSWGSLAVDRQHSVFVVNTSHVATVAELVPRAQADKLGVVARGEPNYRNIRGYFAQTGTPYALKMSAFLSPLGIPCHQPPYGLISAVDYKNHRLLWRRLFGTARDSGPWNLRLSLDLPMGVPNIGGGFITRSGLVFIAATQEQVIRALDVRTGDVLWKARLPAGGQATPMTYMGGDGRQYVVIAAGGKSLLHTKTGNSIVAFSLPRAAEAGAVTSAAVP